MEPIDADKLYASCKFRGDCPGVHCDKCSDYAVEMSDINNAPTLILADILNNKTITNGDIIKLLFPNFLFIPYKKHNTLQMLLYKDNEKQKGLITLIEFDLDWWNSPYNNEIKNEKGKWIESGFADIVKCSNCEESLDFEPPFCPYCGVKMEQ